MTTIPLSDQIAEVERELGFRRRVYDRRVAEGRMTRAAADLHLRRMEAVQETLRALEAAQVPKLL